MVSTYKWAENLCDWALKGGRWRGAVFFGAIGGYTLAVISPGLVAFYLLFEVQEHRSSMADFFADWRLWAAIASALLMHWISVRLN